MNPSRIQRFGGLLQNIPRETWDDIILLDPECQYIGPYKDHYHFGGFASLMVMLALNSYQLKGKAEMSYWHAMHQHLSSCSKPKTRKDLEKILIPFYKKERLPKGKLKRIHRFFSSSYADDLWVSTPDHIIDTFSEQWTCLSRVMNQQKTAKTICFAMKCLGISVLLTKKHVVDFASIPIPVDSRVTSFTEEMRFTSACTKKDIQCVWNQILAIVQEGIPSVSMMHLDSLIWQIGTLTDENLRSYFDGFQLSDLAEKICALKYVES